MTTKMGWLGVDVAPYLLNHLNILYFIFLLFGYYMTNNFKLKSAEINMFKSKSAEINMFKLRMNQT